jgi:protein gp37
MTATAIEWADDVWNPTTGCDQVSPGCGLPRWPGDDPHGTCYALTMAKRLKGMGSAKYQNDGDPRTSGPGFGIAEHPAALAAPLSWRKPRKVFVNSMSDLFHDGVSDEFIASVFSVMAATPQHTYQVLTKRHGRMRSLLGSAAFRTMVGIQYVFGAEVPDDAPARLAWPLPNVWVGVSVEDQKRADLRIPALLDTPAAVRFLSCEPLLGPVDLTRAVIPMGSERGHGLTASYVHTKQCCERLHGIDWVIAGGESGPGARPMHPNWARQLRDQCEIAGVPFFFKQFGDYGLVPRGWREEGPWPDEPGVTVADDGTVYQPGDLTYDPPGPRYGEAVRANHHRAHLTAMYRVGKNEAGRKLDGREHTAFPAGAPT